MWQKDVTILDIRGRVDKREVESGVEKSTYVPEYDAYLEAHIPVSPLFDTIYFSQ